jgi:hypothetical protein
MSLDFIYTPDDLGEQHRPDLEAAFPQMAP